MDKDSKDLTDRIRIAIKKKLVDINAFVDDELPDYIMILVANKRSKSHMEKDLALFLGKDTVEFTNWLWNLVTTLKVNSKSKMPFVTDKNESVSSKKVEPLSDEDIDVLDYDIDAQVGDLNQDDDSLNNDVSISKHPKAIKPESVSDINQSVPIEKANKDVDLRKLIPKSAKVYPVQGVPQVVQRPVEIPIDKQMVSPDDEYDPTKPEFSGTMSSVIYKSYKHMGRPASSFQANKLLLKAVNDATRSILDGNSFNEYYKPTPITMLSSARRESYAPRPRNLVSVRIDPNLDFGPERTFQNSLAGYLEPENGSNVEVSEDQTYVLNQASSDIRKIYRTNYSNLQPPVTTDLTVYDTNKEPSPPVEEETKAPHFIVTLDGIEVPSLKRKFSDSFEESMDVDEEDFSWAEEDTDASPEKRSRVTEKCKYWPSCKNTDNCAFHHPSVPCNMFPDCKFGNRCLYVHPNCKFDALCSKKDCPYTHVSKRKFPLSAQPMKSAKVGIAVCKFYPQCTVKKCAFIHPKPCRYGNRCRMSTCPFTHFNIPSRDQLKWKANASEEL